MLLIQIAFFTVYNQQMVLIMVRIFPYHFWSNAFGHLGAVGSCFGHIIITVACLASSNISVHLESHSVHPVNVQ